MRIQFCGADRTVTGSCHLIEAGGVRVLLDCGMYQGSRELARQLNTHLPDDPRQIDAVILSHGHLDHCGKLPVLVKSGYQGPIYCTPPTVDVARIVLEDAGEIQEEDAAYLNQRSRDPGEEPVRALFTRADVHNVLKLFRRVKYGERTVIKSQRDPAAAGVAFTFQDAGHILGSAYVLLDHDENGVSRRLLFTADIGRFGSPILPDPTPLSGPVDVVITESTYGAKTHCPMEDVGPQLLDCIRKCIQHRSRLIVPSFAVGRTQTIVWYMNRFACDGLIPPIQVYIDSPMGVEVSRATMEHQEYFDKETKDLLEGTSCVGTVKVKLASSMDQSRQINNDAGPCVIIASSPTCEFGRVLHHLKRSMDRENDMVVFVGWTPPNTLGRRLQDGQRRVKIFDRWYDVRCQVRTIHGLSAHADGNELIRFLKPTMVQSTTAFVVHGEEDQAEGFARKLLGNGIGRAIVPAMESSVITSLDGLPPDGAPVSHRTDGD